MILRTLPPVHSPLRPTAVLRAWAALGWTADAVGRARALLQQRYQPRDLRLTDSGTTALALALRLAVARRPDCPRVALPAWACYDLATAADAAGVPVLLYDLDPATLGPDAESLARVLAQGVAAVVLVHAYGLPVDLPGVAALARAAGAVVIEDAAQAVGASLGGRPAGSAGALGVLSFGRGKGWTGGGGGALLLNASAPADWGLAAELPATGAGMAAAMKLTAQWILARPACYALPRALPFLQLGQTRYRAAEPPAGIGAGEAAVLLATDALQPPEAARRQAHAARLGAAVLTAGAGQVPVGWRGGQAGWLRLPLLPTDATLRRARAPTAPRLGIMPGYPLPLSRLPGFEPRISGPSPRCPGAEELAARLHTLPTHGLLTPRDLARLERWLAGD